MFYSIRKDNKGLKKQDLLVENMQDEPIRKNRYIKDSIDFKKCIRCHFPKGNICPIQTLLGYNENYFSVDHF